jgi:hypothetical protein
MMFNLKIKMLVSTAVTLLVLALSPVLYAGGGVALKDDKCIISIGFYTAHFTAYQTDGRGNEQFCEDLPDAGGTLFVLDYLHSSLKEVPVDFRIIRNETGMGEFARLEHIEALDNIDQHTVFYREPSVESNGSYQVEHFFAEAGEYVGIVSAGHPSNGKTYYAVFPFTVGILRLDYWAAIAFFFAVGLFTYIMVKKSRTATTSSRLAD